ncbi:acyltransferase family protein [Gilvimarinus sp. F26214L]|uniref:acyltransferase family protein n=1 Tax=Gilvimarinus sp. DZF01 TaxID=3461371 RepID=UPI004045330C
MRARTSTRLGSLDALRGVAALLVVWQHSSEIFVRNPEIARHGTFLADMANTVDFGRIGVICFFLISGFVIPYSLSGTGAGIRRFAIRRFFRLYPAYWVSLLAALLGTIAFGGPDFSIGTMAANVTMVQDLLGFTSIQGLYWTLTVELVFYVLCALVFSCGMLERPLALLLIAWSGLGAFVGWQLIGRVFPALGDVSPTVSYMPYCIAVMFCGALIRYCYERDRGFVYALLAVGGVFSLPLTVLVLHVVSIDIGSDPVRFGAAHIIALAVFVAVLRIGRQPPAFLILLGTVSYSLYLFHPVVIGFLGWLIEHGWGTFLAGRPLGVYIALSAALTFPLAWLVYRGVEAPAIGIGRSLSGPRRELAPVTIA